MKSVYTHKFAQNLHFKKKPVNWLQKISIGYYRDMGYSAWWIGPSGEIFTIQDTHHGWIYKNMDLLRDEYDIDIQEWSMNKLEESRSENYESLRNEMIKEQAWQQEVDESQVILSDDQEEELGVWAGEAATEGSEIEKVDLLIEKGWIRVANKVAQIHIEGNVEIPGFWDRAEMMMIKLFPQVWSNTNFNIIVNNKEIYSDDLQNAGTLRKAIEQTDRRNGYVMYQR